MWVTKQLLVHFEFDSFLKKHFCSAEEEIHSVFKQLLRVNGGIKIKHCDRIDRQMTEVLFLSELFL